MLLIVGGDSDPNTRRVVDQAHMRGIEYFFWDTDDDDCLQIAWDFDTQKLDLGSNRLEPKAIYLRWNVFGGETTRNLAAFETIQAYAFAWPDVKLLNRRTIVNVNNKSQNLRIAKAVGFEIPKSLVMSNLSPLLTHPDPNAHIAKPLSGGAHTLGVDELILDSEKIMSLPPQFIQERLNGENVRLFSVDGKLFCFHLETQLLDYREDQTVGVKQIEVPAQLVEPSSWLVEQKQFDYCAIDFRCRHEFESPVFLEINSFPMFVRFDDAGENCIVNAILDFLIR